jgi:cell division septation protein DedD
MLNNKFVLALSCAVLLALTGCSRQQSDWQKTRETNTTDAYEQFLKKYPAGEFTAQAQARVKELYEERDWQKARDADTPEAYQAFLKQYPEGKWTEEARIRVENFTLAQAPSGAAGTPGATTSGAATPSAGTPNAGTPNAGTPGVTSAGGAQSSAAAAGAGTDVPGKTAPAPGVPAKPKPAANAPQSAKKGSGAYGIQLGAFKSGADAANRRWTYLQKAYPAILSGLSSRVVPKKTATGKVYRLQATGLTEKQARDICHSLKAKSQACVLVPPATG